jgi:hypothetical protein
MTGRINAAACVILLALASGCAQSPARTEKSGSPVAETAVGTRKLNAAPAVRVSAEGMEAAEPATASGREGAVYVTWVEHQGGGRADVWLAHFDGEGQASAPPARVNPNEGEATAWHGELPTAAAASGGRLYIAYIAKGREGHDVRLVRVEEE